MTEQDEPQQDVQPKTPEPLPLPPLEPDRELISWEQKGLDPDKGERR